MTTAQTSSAIEVAKMTELKRGPYSPSRIKRFRNCPFSFKLAYIDKVPGIESIPMIVGKQCHELFADYFAYCGKENKETDYDKYRELVLARIPHVPEAGRGLFYHVCQRFIDTHVYNVGSDVRLEYKFCFTKDWQNTEWDAPNAYFRGIIDLLMVNVVQGALIRDYKTGFKIMTEGDIENDIQMRCYALAASKLVPNVDYYTLELDFVQFNIVKPVPFYSWQLLEFQEELFATIDEIENTKEFKPRLTTDCVFCNYRDGCPLYQQVLKSKAVPGAEFTEKLMQSQSDVVGLLWLKNKLQSEANKEVDDAIKGVVPEHAGIQLKDGKTLGWSTKEKYTYDTSSVIEFVRSFDIDEEEIFKYLSITHGNMKKFCRKHKIDIERAKRRGKAVNKTTSQFGAGKQVMTASGRMEDVSATAEMPI